MSENTTSLIEQLVDAKRRMNVAQQLFNVSSSNIDEILEHKGDCIDYCMLDKNETLNDHLEKYDREGNIEKGQYEIQRQ